MYGENFFGAIINLVSGKDFFNYGDKVQKSFKQYNTLTFGIDK